MFATRRSLIPLAAIVVVISLLSLGVYVWWQRRRLDVGDVPLLKTPAWEFERFDEMTNPLLLRRETEAGGALLLKRNDLETVYRYDPETRGVRAVSAATWEKAGGKISKCWDQMSSGSFGGLRRDDHDHKLFAGDREVPTAGGFIRNNQTSPSGKWMAVHSAAGPAEKSIIPDGSYIIFGQRYHEILSLPDAKRVGKPVRIPVTDKNDFLDICWSADEKFVVYTTYFFNMLVVVDTGL